MQRSCSRVCINCSSNFKFTVSQLKAYKGAGQFCSRQCHYGYRNKMRLDHLVGLDSAGYRNVILASGETIREHRLIMEKVINRKLSKNEHVHHINGIKSDNRIENLIVLTASDHHVHHGSSEKSILGLKKGHETSRKKWAEWRKNNWAKDHPSCVNCGTNKIHHQAKGKCRKCYLASFGAKKRLKSLKRKK